MSDPFSDARMPRAELRPAKHTDPAQADVTIIEVWWHGEMVATIYPGQGPGIKFVTKHVMAVAPEPSAVGPLALAVIHIAAMTPTIAEFADEETRAQILRGEKAKKSWQN